MFRMRNIWGASSVPLCCHIVVHPLAQRLDKLTVSDQRACEDKGPRKAADNVKALTPVQWGGWG